MMAGRVNVAPVARRHRERALPPCAGPRRSWCRQGTQGLPLRPGPRACRVGLYQGTLRHHAYRDKAFETSPAQPGSAKVATIDSTRLASLSQSYY
jgi:hypothetical protein